MNEYNFNNLTIHYNFIMMTFIANLNKQVYNVESFPLAFYFSQLDWWASLLIDTESIIN